MMTWTLVKDFLDSYQNHIWPQDFEVLDGEDAWDGTYTMELGAPSHTAGMNLKESSAQKSQSSHKHS